jgi:hypothetical protein
MEYPPDFPAQSRDKVEAEKIHADQDFDSAEPSPQDIERHVKAYVLRIFLVFVNEACALHLWPVDQMKLHCSKFLSDLIEDAYLEKDMQMFHFAFQTGAWAKHHAYLIRQFEKRPEYQQALLETAEARIRTHQHTMSSLLTHSEDYRTVNLRGETYALTSQQAQMIQILHEAHKNGKPDVSIALVLEQLEKESSRWQDTFKSNPIARKALIKAGIRKGTLRLNL